MDPVIHSVANATPEHRLKSTPSFIRITDFPFMQWGAHFVSKYLLGNLISIIFTKRAFILATWISILDTTRQDTSSAKSPPSFNRLSASVGAASPISLKPPTHQASTAAYRSRNGPSTTTRRPSTIEYRSVDHPKQQPLQSPTPSLLSQPPTENVLDATFRRIEARDAARKMDVIQTKETATDDPKAPSVPPVTSKEELSTIRENGHQENSGSQKTLRPTQAGLLKWSQPTTIPTEK